MTAKKQRYMRRGPALEALCRRKGIKVFPPPVKYPPIENAHPALRASIGETYKSHADLCDALEWLYYARHGIRLPCPPALRRARAKLRESA